VSATTDAPIIEVRQLVKVYGGETRAVDGISFEVAPGELFGFLGPNGAGKTTTIRILATLLRQTEGTARVAGFDVATRPGEVRRRLGLAMQTPALDAFSTGRETLELAGRLHRMPAREIRRRTDELLQLMGLAAVANKLTGTYSGGMKRRLDLASALVNRPPVLILDEPTEGLDPQSRAALWEELERISRAGTTMLLTTHYMEEADRLCSRLAIIDNGRIVIEGAPEELKRGIGADTVVLQLEASDGDLEHQRGHVRRLLEGMLGAEAVASHPAGVSLAVPNASAAIPALLRRLDGDGVQIAGLQMSQPSLDSVFMKYTGRHIREEAADQPIILGW
ncbi:MAG TPA: ATP-binding cassette domain-containing protein, partial [Candidatus Limnocylindria bacterium]|nr:ATP-binding cassette domain-containing protein [Candidatus Limnocylindria bacterium]